ncbi:MAG: VOC family protein [Anaerolineae bacterium]|nr:VOC family protein [Anaerolineae bacterium]
MPKEQGKVGWVDLTVPDAAKIRDFYQAVVGWSAESVSMGDFDDYNMNSADGHTAAGVCHKRGNNALIPSQWMIYINVDTLADSLAKCTELGGKIVVEPRKLSDNKQFAVIEDPAGAVCTLLGK